MGAGQHRAYATALTEGRSITCSLANWKAQRGLRKTNSCPLTCPSAFLHQGRLSIQMSCIFTSVVLPQELHCTHLDEYNKRSSGPASRGVLLKGSESQHSLKHERHGEPRHAHSGRRGNTAFPLFFPQRKHHRQP